MKAIEKSASDAADALFCRKGKNQFFLAALVGLGAKDIDIKAALRVYLAAAVAGLLVVQLLHFTTPLMPYNFYCRINGVETQEPMSGETIVT